MSWPELGDMWIGVHRSSKPYIGAVYNIAGAARHIGNYLNVQSYRVHKYVMSTRWMFPG